MAGKSVVDLAIVGGGSGGLQLLWNLVQPGRFAGSIALVDYSGGRDGGLGGTCLNVGCIPKKLFHHAGMLARSVRGPEALAYGLPPALRWSPSEAGPWQWPQLTGNVGHYIRSLNFDLWRRVRALGAPVEYLKGEAVFESGASGRPFQLSVGDRSLQASSVVVCTGSRPRVPESLAGDPRVLTSDQLFWRPEPLAASVAVVGGGYIALESASMLAALGHSVSVFMEEPLRAMDRQCAGLVRRSLEAEGVRFVRRDPRAVTPSDLAPFGNVLVAAGRVPNLPRGLDGPITAVIDPRRPGLLALGDVVEGHPQLTPVAHHTARQVAEHLVSGAPIAPFPAEQLASAVFTTPHEYAFAGLSQEEAEGAFGKAAVRVYLSRYNTLDTSMLSTAEPDGIDYDHDGACLAKLVCTGPDQRVVGIHFVGPHAAETIQAFSLALKLGAKKSDFDSLLAIHPTTAEEFCFLTKTPDEDFIKKAGCGGGGSC